MNENINQNLDIKDLEGEIWKPIEGYEELYGISNYGRIKSYNKTITDSTNKERFWKEKILKLNILKSGYCIIHLYKNRKRKAFFIHKLVIENFSDKYLDKNCVNHKNGLKYDNRLENLEWVTYKENMKHAIKNGLFNNVLGENHYNSRLNNKIIKQIREEYIPHIFGWLKLAKKYNTTHQNIGKILKRKSWKHI